jgi:hypothetical protein
MMKKQKRARFYALNLIAEFDERYLNFMQFLPNKQDSSKSMLAFLFTSNSGLAIFV